MALITSFQLAVAAFLLLFAFLVTAILTTKRKGPPLPPGPTPLPIVGNVTDLPPPGSPEFKHWLKHKDAYGPVSSITVMGQTIVLIHDAQVAFELMEKRSSIYSSRPVMFFVAKMCGWDKWIAFQDNNQLVKSYRRDIHSIIGSKKHVANYSQLQLTESRRFLLQVYRAPEQTIEHLKNAIGAVILEVAYGYKIDRNKTDPLITLVEDAMVTLSDAATVGKWPVDIIPLLRYLPEWMPGTSFKRIGRLYKRLNYEVAERPYVFAKSQFASKTLSPSLASNLLEKETPTMTPEKESRLKISLATLYTGGADTQVATLKWFFLDMILHPHIQKRAQQEIDHVVGLDRLPTFSDRENLPYVNAVFKEVLRWNSIATLGLPHVGTQSDTIVVKTPRGEEEYSIPKVSMLLPAIWWFMRDPERYSNPDEFNPERFLGDNPETDPATMTFGFGRRICPGRILADSSAWLVMAQTLAVFDISKKRDDMGREFDVHPEGIPGLVYHPVPFGDKMQVTIRPDRKELLERLEKEETWGKGETKRGKEDWEILRDLELGVGSEY